MAVSEEQAHRTTAINVGKQLTPLLVALILWEIIGQSGVVHYYFLPPLSDIFAEFFGLLASGELFHHTYLTLRRAFVGLLVACAFGIPIGILSARNSLFKWFWNPVFALGYPIPLAALIPIFILWLGNTDLAKITLVSLGCFWPIAINCRDSAGNINKSLIWSARMMGTSNLSLLWRVFLPASLPGILTGIQIALPVSLIVTFVFEMIAGGGGLGYLQIQAANSFLAVEVYATILAIMIVGFTLDRLFRLFRRMVLTWD